MHTTVSTLVREWMDFEAAMKKVSQCIQESSFQPTSLPQIKSVIFNRPTTIVFWQDSTKTVLKCGKDEVFDEEKAIALCYMKKCLGNKSSYYKTIREYLSVAQEKRVIKEQAELYNKTRLKKQLEKQAYKNKVTKLAKKRLKEEKLNNDIWSELRKINKLEDSKNVSMS